MNRIQNAIDLLRKRLEGITPEVITRVSQTATLGIDEYVAVQEIKSVAHIGDVISLEEACTVYNILGETLGHFNNQPLAERITVIRLVSELLEKLRSTI